MAWLPHSIAEAALSGSGVPDVDMDTAWAHLQERLGAAEELVRTAPVNRNALDHAAGMRHLMVLMAVGIDMALRVDPDPVLAVARSKMDDIVTWGMECPDCVYLNAEMRAGESYRLFGNRGTARYVGLQTMDGIAATANCLVDELELDDDGNFEVILSADEQPGNWLRLVGEHPVLTVRNFLYDWDTETPAALTIERIGPGVDPGELLGLLTEAADIHDPAAASRVAAALAVGRCYDPDPSVSARLLERSADLAVATGDDDVVADALLGRLITYSGVPAFSASSLAWVDELIALPHSRSREDAVIAHSVATMAAFDLADLSAVRAHLRAGIAGSEELRLPVLRAQLRWMEAVHAIWCGDFASAAQHLDTASSAHEQTELYGAGSRLIVLSCLLRELGQPVDDPAALYSDEDLGGDDMLGMAGAVLVATRTGPEFHEEAAALLAGQRAAGHVWIGLGHAVLLAHVSADHGLIDHAAELIARLDGHRSEIALIGQIGIVGPVALATARLRALLGERTAARRDLEVAEQIARRGGGAPSLLRVRLLACELDAADGRLAASAVAGLIDDAERLGMHGVAAAARRLLD